MSNIAEFLQKILSARYGKDVRQSIHDAIKEVDAVADTAQNSATKAAEWARESEQASYLNAQEAETFRNEAEQFRNEAATFTPDNYAEFVQTATETKERVDVLEENVETNKNNIEKVSFKVDTVIEKADLRIKETASGERIHLTDSADAKVVEFGLYGKATQDGTPSPDNEIDVEISGASGSVVVKSCCKNLLKSVRTGTIDYEGVNIKLNDDKSITLNGTPNRDFSVDLTRDFNKKGKFFINNCTKNNEENMLGLFAQKQSNADWYKWDFGDGIYLDNLNGDSYYIAYRVNVGKQYNNYTIYPMIRACDENGNAIGDDTYEPYKETSSTIPTPNGLAGIAVDSGGNYTDANEKPLACDVIIKYADGSGEYIQRIEKAVFDGVNNKVSRTGNKSLGYGASFPCDVSDNSFLSKLAKVTKDTCDIVSTHFISKTGFYWSGSAEDYGCGIYRTNNSLWFNINKKVGDSIGINTDTATDTEFNAWLQRNPVTMWSVLENPIRTPLTAEQIGEIEKLCTFYPVTNIYNDADCGMKATYSVDAKRYIDNKIAELATAMINNI